MDENHSNKGISMLEVMIVFAITFLLLAATLPNFQEHTIRTRVGEGLKLVEAVKQSLIESCKTDGNAVISEQYEPEQSSDPARRETEYVQKILMEADCRNQSMGVVVWTGNTGANPDPIIELSTDFLPDVVNGGSTGAYYWTCRVLRGELGHVPLDCQKRHRKG